jgi:hypothetical protein
MWSHMGGHTACSSKGLAMGVQQCCSNVVDITQINSITLHQHPQLLLLMLAAFPAGHQQPHERGLPVKDLATTLDAVLLQCHG